MICVSINPKLAHKQLVNKGVISVCVDCYVVHMGFFYRQVETEEGIEL